MSPEVQKKQLELLKKNYNAILTRYRNMEKWIEAAPIEEQFKYEDEIYFVINELNRLFNEIRKIDKNITPKEALRGFKK